MKKTEVKTDDGKPLGIDHELEKIDGTIERDIIKGLVVDDKYIESLAEEINPMYLQFQPLRRAAQWCLDYYRDHKQAPGPTIQDIYLIYLRDERMSEVESELIADFLMGLSNEYIEEEKHFDTDFWVKETRKYFESLRIRRLMEEVGKAQDIGDIDRASDLLSKYENGYIDDLDRFILEEKEFLGEKIPTPRVYISPWLYRGAITMIFGEKGVGKTFLSLATAVLLTSHYDERELAIAPWEVENTVDVLYVDGENDQSEFQKRVSSLRRGLGGEKIRDVFYFCSNRQVRMGQSEINLTKARCRNGLYKFLKSNKNIKVVIFDNLASLAPGIDTNSKQDWDPINQWLIKLRHLGVATVIVDHAGKDQIRGPRGTSGKTDVLDCCVFASLPRDYDDKDGCRLNISYHKRPRNLVKKANLSGFEFRIESDEEQSVAKMRFNVNTFDSEREFLTARLLEGQPIKSLAGEVDVSEFRVAKLRKVMIGVRELMRRTGKDVRPTKKGRDWLAKYKENHPEYETFEEKK